MTMLENYIKVAWRNLKKHRVYSLINISGLALGMACGLFIILYIFEETSYDKFWDDSDRIYRVYIDGNFLGQEINSPTTPSGMAHSLRTEFSQVESATRFRPIRQEIMFQHRDMKIYIADVAYADSNFFDVFSIPLLMGDPKEVLASTGSCVISQRIAQAFFGEENPIGKILNYDNRWNYRVTGVMAPLPGKSHFSYDVYMTSNEIRGNWIENGHCTYFKTKEGANPDEVIAQINDYAYAQLSTILEEQLGLTPEEFLEQGNSYEYGYQNVERIHLHSNLQAELKPNSKVEYLYILGVIGILVLMVAGINFTNLVTARSASRSKEVGVRKVVGAYQPLIVRQFLTEAIIQSVIALVIAMMLLELALPSLSRVMGISGMRLFGGGYGWVAVIFVFLALIVGIFSGSYPALYLSSFDPSQIIKGQFKSGKKGLLTRRILVIIQFSISLSLIIGLSVMLKQLKFMQQKDLGFQPEQVIVVPIQTDFVTENFHEIKDGMLATVPGIESISRGSHIPGVMEMVQGIFRVGTSDLTYPMWFMGVDDDFLNTMEIDLLEGVEPSFDVAKTGGVVINKKAVEFLGLKNPIGTSIGYSNDFVEQSMQVVGVIENFHTESFDQEIKPMILYYDPETWFSVIRIDPGQWEETISGIEDYWEKVEPSHPFRYTLLQDDFARLYEEEKNLSQLFLVFTILSIWIACMGLFGLALYNSELRTKEIGIRRALGATTGQTWLLLTKEFGYLTGISILISWPISYFAMNFWLESFVYHIEVPLQVFLSSSMIALCIALVTVSVQTIRTSMADPIQALRYE
ncbi:ABC transporter permease [Cryomorphaceae bacterium]|nr:ABC transporter permease [Cryomorphaceae bacterium]